jgi:hypothetical protein
MFYRSRYQLRALFIALLLFMTLNPGQYVSAAGQVPASSTDLYTTNLWRTGVSQNNIKLPGGSVDPHYQLSDVSVGGTYYKSTTKPLCQPGAGTPDNPIFPAPAVAVQEYGNSAGFTRIDAGDRHPWKGVSSNADWIGANADARDSTSPSCPNPSDFRLAYLWGGPTDPYKTAEWVPTWNIYTFGAKQNFSIHASSNVDTSSLQLQITGTSDNEMAVTINNCELKAINFKVDEQLDQYTNLDSKWADPSYTTNQLTKFEVPAKCLFVDTGKGETNSIKFMVKSGDDLTGLRIADISITGLKAPNRPYFTVNGGDAVAGMAFKSANNTCNQINSSSLAGQAAIIRSWNYDAGSYYGAGSQAGALALGQISSFVTGLNPAANAGYPTALQSSLSSNPADVSFANKSPDSGVGITPPSGYGGGFGSYGGCADDYFGSYVASGASPAGSVDLNSISTSGVYSYKNDIKLKGKLSSGIHVTIVVNGSVTLTGTITYDYNSLSKIPSLTVIAKDNIQVLGSVSEIHGFYVAQGGKFATCATKVGNTYVETTNYDTCNQQLTVYGAVAANAIHLDRSYGSIIGGGVGEPPAQPAEIFLYTPEAWLGGIGNCPADPASCLKNKSDYSVIKDLPPIL